MKRILLWMFFASTSEVVPAMEIGDGWLLACDPLNAGKPIPVDLAANATLLGD